jgi:hypothetical protein
MDGGGTLSVLLSDPEQISDTSDKKWEVAVEERDKVYIEEREDLWVFSSGIKEKRDIEHT